MRAVCFIKAFLALLTIAVAYEDIDDKYYDILLANKQRIQKFFSCLIETDPCDAFGQHVKKHMQEFLSDGCKECDTKQKHYGHIIINLLKKDYPEMYEAYEAKYDPSRKLLMKLDKQVSVY